MPNGMPYAAFLDAVIDDGADEVRRSYLRPDQAMKRDGALAGFEACRGLSPEELLDLRDAAMAETHSRMRLRDAAYWYWRMREAQIEWVLDVVSAASFAQDKAFVFPPTARGMEKAVDILGIAAA